MRKFSSPPVSGIADKDTQRAVKECVDTLGQMASDTDQGVVSVGDVKAGTALYRSGQGSTKGGKEVRGLSQAESAIAAMLSAVGGDTGDLKNRLTTVEGLEWFRGQLNKVNSGSDTTIDKSSDTSKRVKINDFIDYVQDNGGGITVDATTQDKLVLLFGEVVWYGSVGPIPKDVITAVSLDASVNPPKLNYTKETIWQGVPSPNGQNGGWVTVSLNSADNVGGRNTIWTSATAPILSPIVTVPCNGAAFCGKGKVYSFSLVADGRNANGFEVESSQMFGFVMKL